MLIHSAIARVADHPLIALAVLAFVILAAAVHMTESAFRRTSARSQTLSTHLTNIQSTLEELSQRVSEATAPPRLAAGLDMGRRSKAVSLLDRGENLDTVATMVGASRSEMELLLKVRRIAVRQPD